MPDITSYTTSAEYDAILAEYGIEGGVDTDAETEALGRMSEAIRAGGDENFDDVDLLSVYVELTNELPDWMLSPEEIVADPSAFPELWEEEFAANLRELQVGHPGIAPQADSLLSALAGVAAPAGDPADPAEEADLIAEVEAFLAGLGEDSETASETAEGVLDLFQAADLMAVASLFISMGSPGLALLMYVAYALAPAMEELQEAALFVMEDAGYTIEDALDTIDSINPEDIALAQADTQRAQAEIQVAQTVLQAMTQFMQTAANLKELTIEAASNLLAGGRRTDEGLIRAI